MRQFVVVGHDVPTTPDFSLDNLPGAGRLDVLCRTVTAGLLLSHGIRENSRVHLVLDDEYTVRFDGATLQGVHPDERSTAARVRSALEMREEAIGHVPVDVSPGIQMTRVGLVQTLDSLAGEGTVYQLHEDGKPVVEAPIPDDLVFVLSDNRDFTAGQREHIDDACDARLRLGPERLHADHAVTVAHNWLDTDGFERY